VSWNLRSAPSGWKLIPLSLIRPALAFCLIRE
jgi:hypothetical protein